MTTCAEKDKTLSAYDIKGIEKNLITYKNKGKSRDGYMCIYE